MTEQINIDELERLAKAATPGPWSQSGFRVTAKELGYDRVADTEFDNDSMAENAAFIAAANPATVLALISQLRALGDRAMHLERRLSDANGEVLRLKVADQHALRLQAGHDEAVLKIDEARQRATDAEQIATARGHTINGLRNELQAVKVERDALAAKLKEQDAWIDDLLATCHRLALELECLLLDIQREAADEEREACAKLCEEAEIPFDIDVWMNSTKKEMTAATANALAAAIRARGQK